MLLSVRFLNDVASVNSFEPTTEVRFNKGSSQIVYIQLADASLDSPNQGFSPSGRRYVPPAGSLLTVLLSNVDDAKKVSRVATQPFPGDLSMWSFPVLATDPLNGTVAMQFVLQEPTRVLRGYINTGLEVSC